MLNTFKLIVSCLIALSFVVSASTFQSELVDAALERTTKSITYDGSYFSIAYPNGDVPEQIGVCTDLVVRSYRKFGVDLQKLVHEDMLDHFESYPSKKIWGLNRPDSNIDHRRVPNLRVFFARHGRDIPVTDLAENYQPGDLVTWSLPGNLPHIGIVSNSKSPGGTPLIIHNIGAGPKLENTLFNFPITGHYRYEPFNSREFQR